MEVKWLLQRYYYVESALPQLLTFLWFGIVGFRACFYMISMGLQRLEVHMIKEGFNCSI